MPTSLEAPSFGRHRSAPPPPRFRPSLAGAAVALLVAILAVGAVVVLVMTVVGLRTTEPDSPNPDLATEMSVAGDAAEVMLTTWARPGSDYDQWWSDLRPLLSAGARVDYEMTDPSQLPELTVTGEPEIVAGPSKDTLTVYFATTAGRFGVDMSRRGDRYSWRMIRILFPGQKSTYS